MCGDGDDSDKTEFLFRKEIVVVERPNRVHYWETKIGVHFTERVVVEGGGGGLLTQRQKWSRRIVSCEPTSMSESSLSSWKCAVTVCF